MRARQGLRLGLAVLIGALSSTMVGIGPASAHVTVNPREAVQGSYAKLAFRVPNERSGAATVKLEVVIPIETAIASVSVRPTPGWTAVLERATLPTPLKVHDTEVTEAVSRITWTAAEGNAIQPSQFQEFEVSAGPLPAVDRIVFKALQTYSNGEVVRWIEEPPAAGGAEPEQPAPVLRLVKAPGATTQAAYTNLTGGTAAGDPADDATATWALVAGLAGLLTGLIGMVLGLLAWRRSRTATSS